MGLRKLEKEEKPLLPLWGSKVTNDVRLECQIAKSNWESAIQEALESTSEKLGGRGSVAQLTMATRKVRQGFVRIERVKFKASDVTDGFLGGVISNSFDAVLWPTSSNSPRFYNVNVLRYGPVRISNVCENFMLTHLVKIVLSAWMCH